LAVIVTVWFWAGPSFVANDHVHVPAALVPPLVTVPMEALSVIVFPGLTSDHVPLFAADWPSLTEAVALVRLMTGGVFEGAATTRDPEFVGLSTALPEQLVAVYPRARTVNE
jgi:hypothetical protein